MYYRFFYYCGIEKIDEDGLDIKTRGRPFHVSFAECVKNFSKEYPTYPRKAVGYRDYTVPVLVFCTDDPVIILFQKKGIRSMFSKGKSRADFYIILKALESMRYYTYDLA